MRNSLFGVYHPTHKLVLIVCDLVALAFAFFCASQLRLGENPEFGSFEYLSLNLIIISSLFIGNAYTSMTLRSAPKLPLRSFFTVLASAIPCALFIYFSGPEKFTSLFGRGVFPVAIIIFGTLSIINRISCNYLFRVENDKRKIAVIGSMRMQHTLELILENSIYGFTLTYLPKLNELEDYDAIVITPEHVPDIKEQQLLVAARLEGAPIFSLSDFIENFLFFVPVNEINNDWIIRADGFQMLHSLVTLRLKRFFDVIAALMLLVLSSPLCLCAMLLTKLCSRGPVLFAQARVGFQGRNFTIYKFRTMRTDAEIAGPQWATHNDPRIFPLGRFLRATRIDELPQCWNILKGDMSLIGPRPERPEFTRELSKEIPYYELRHVVKPGITGWAQVSYPYGASKEDALKKLEYDLYYIKNHSLLLDFNILLRTVLTTLHLGGR